MPRRVFLTRRPSTFRAIEINPQDPLHLPQEFVPHNVCTRIGRKPSGQQSGRGCLGQFRKSLWQLDENISYMRFLAQNQQLFGGSPGRQRTIRGNLLMSGHVGTRSPDQCRSHHQKMMLYHGDIPDIITYIRLLAQQQNLNQELPPPLHSQPSPPPSEAVEEREEEEAGVSPQTVFDWDSWMAENEKVWEERMVEEWLNGGEDIYRAV